MCVLNFWSRWAAGYDIAGYGIAVGCVTVCGFMSASVSYMCAGMWSWQQAIASGFNAGSGQNCLVMGLGTHPTLSDTGGSVHHVLIFNFRT